MINGPGGVVAVAAVQTVTASHEWTFSRARALADWKLGRLGLT